MEIIFFITLLLYLFTVGTFTDFVDYDFFARLIVGKTFFQTGEILKYDFLSYSSTHPWYDHEWGASLIFYFVKDNFGDLGLQILKAICLFTTFFFLIGIIKLRRKVLHKGEIFPIFNFLFFFVVLQPVLNLVFSLRCHHFTFMFFAIWLYTLERARLEKNYRILWVLPLLMTVWSNIHGGCFMGLGITGLYVLGGLFSKKPFMPYIYTLIFSFIAMFINPYGLEYVKFLIQATTMNRVNIIEWASPFGNYFLLKLIKFKLLLSIFIGVCIYRFYIAFKKNNRNLFKIWADFDKTKFILLLAMLLLTLKSMRFISYFIFILIPFCYDDFYCVFNKKLPDIANKSKEILLFVFVFVTFILNASTRDFEYTNFHSIFPLSEVEYLIENNIKGNVMAPFETGSYVAYKLYPNNFILQDGRYEEVYPIELNDNYVRDITLGAEGWLEKFNSIHHDVVIAYTFTPLFENMKTHPDYYFILKSATFGLFIRKDTWKRSNSSRVPTSDPEFYKKTLWNTQIGWQRK